MSELSRVVAAPELLLELGADSVALYRKVSKTIEAGRSLRLTPRELFILARVGLLSMLSGLANDYQEMVCQERNVRSRFTSAAATGSIRETAEATTKSSGMTTIEDAKEALALAQAICRKQS